MQKTSDSRYSSKSFLCSFGVFTILGLLCIGLVSYLVDPFFQYRLRPDNTYLLNTRFVNPGLIKYADYNMVVFGSSMVQNYDMTLFKTDDQTKPLRIAIGATNYEEMAMGYSLLDKQKVKSMVINMDLAPLNERSEKIKYPDYTYKSDVLHQLKYLYSYETCVRYIPVNIVLSAYGNVEKEIPEQIKKKMDVEQIGNFIHEKNFYNQRWYIEHLYRADYGIGEQKLDGMEERMKSRADKFINRLDINNNRHIDYIIVLPPYSVAYWGYTTKKKYYDTFIEMIRYINKQLSVYENVHIACFYDIDEIMNLDGYADLTHFNPEISNFIAKNLQTEEYFLTPSNIDIRLQRLDSLVSVFNKENAEWNVH